MGDAAGGKPPRVFDCAVCKLSVPYSWHGRRPKFGEQLVFVEDVYMTVDPFAQTPMPLCLGGKCVICTRKVCMGCSTFYTKRFCSDCGPLLLSAGVLPPEMAQTVKSLAEAGQAAVPRQA
ncbi:cysteine-rich domain-containing protein [Baffinella frigidus]|nr:cysteine-rich domain-containing protein [Cryptophyta sp. CCMP2293]|mmetsp:Transcript_15862/g.38272  ORF Transcript_15862/g.38272 Transcript_15862/m.38272 type:complete len:120 (-) Transcript_15862:72-431(-)